MPTFCISIQAKSVSLNEVLSNHGLKEKYNFQEKTKTYFDIFKAFFTHTKKKQTNKQKKKKKLIELTAEYEMLLMRELQFYY